MVLVDSCLFGYLTWSLYPAGADQALIAAYVEEIALIIAPCFPKLIYLSPVDIEASFKWICDKRGGGTEERFIHQAVQSVYGRKHHLAGFAGLISYWQDYRTMTDEWFNRLGTDKLAMRVEDHNRDDSWDQIRSFLNLPVKPECADIVEESQRQITTQRVFPRYIGLYTDTGLDIDVEGATRCEISLDADTLYIHGGGPSIWPHTRLLYLSPGVFQVESLPIQLTFLSDPDRLHITGPELFSGPVERLLLKVTADIL